MSKYVKPLYDRIIVKPIEPEKDGLIARPGSQKEKPVQGTVIEIGCGKQNPDGSITPLLVKKGDIVMFGKFSGTEIEVDSQEYLLMRESDCVCIFSEREDNNGSANI